jgi:hypothetical protein
VLYDWIKDKKLKNSRRTWQQMVDQGILAYRSAESLKNFWKMNQKLSIEECIEFLLKKDAKYCHQYPNPIYPHDEVVIKSNMIDEASVPKMKKPQKISTQKIESQEDEKHQIEPDTVKRVDFKKRPVVRNYDDIAPDEDLTPLKEEIDYDIKVVGCAELDSEESESEEDSKEIQLEDQPKEEEENKVKKKSEASVSTPTKLEDANQYHPSIQHDNRSPVNPAEMIRCSQNSLSNFFEGIETNDKNEE